MGTDCSGICVTARGGGRKGCRLYTGRKTKHQLQVALKSPPFSEETHVHKTPVAGLPRKTSSRGTEEECQPARRMPPSLCLLLPPLLLSAATAALPPEGGLAGPDSDSGVSSP